MTWADEMPSLIVTSVTPPCQGLLLFQYVPNSSVPSFSYLLPLSFLGGASVQDSARFCTYLEFKEIADAREPRFFTLLSLVSRLDRNMS